MDAACPKCESDDFDVLDEDVDIQGRWASYKCVCNKCGKVFTIDTDIVIKSVR